MGRLADLRQHPGVPAGDPAGATRPGQARDRRRRPDRRRPGAARQLRGPRRLVGRPGAAAHAVHAGAQRGLRHAAARRTRRGTTTRCSTRRAWSSPRCIAKIHTVEWTTADPRPPGAADRHARQLVRARRGAGPQPARPDQRQRGPQRHPRLRDRAPRARRTPSPRSSWPSTGCTRWCPTTSTCGRTADPHRVERHEFLDLAGLRSRDVAGTPGRHADLLYSFGTAHPGAVTLHNFPRFMQRFAPRRRHGDRPRRHRHPAVP